MKSKKRKSTHVKRNATQSNEKEKELNVLFLRVSQCFSNNFLVSCSIFSHFVGWLCLEAPGYLDESTRGRLVSANSRVMFGHSQAESSVLNVLVDIVLISVF